MQINAIAVDLAKNVFQVHGYSGTGERVLCKRLGRQKFARLLRDELDGSCDVVMEACGSAHYWGRCLRDWGYRVRLIPPQHVRAYVVGNKTDGNDADAIYEASQRRGLRDVPVKSLAQQDVLLAHRMRERRKKARVGLVNQLRGALAERGLVCGRGLKPLRELVHKALAESITDQITPYFLEHLQALWSEWQALDAQIEAAGRTIAEHARHDPACQSIQAVEGIGPITASALVASVGDPANFRSGRQMAAWLGVTPKERSSGDSRRLGGITKRGDRYLRTLLIHGGRAVIKAASKRDSARNRWARALVERRGTNKAAVAVANKNARIVWALLTTGECYRPAAIASM
jgi:transposase